MDFLQFTFGLIMFSAIGRFVATHFAQSEGLIETYYVNENDPNWIPTLITED